MAGFEATFDDKKVRDFLKQLTVKTKQIADKNKKFVDLLSVIVFADVINHFENERGPKSRWQSWSKRYQNFMLKLGNDGNKILQDSGTLRNAFKPANYRTTSNAIVWFNKARTKKGFPYAFAHNEGGPVLPQRQFMWLSDNAMNKFEDQVLKFLEG